MLGIPGSDDLQATIDAGARVAKIVKPYRNTEFVCEEAGEDESTGYVAPMFW